MYLVCKGRGVVEVKKKSWIKRLFCSHNAIIVGERCSSIGLRRISGEDKYTVCEYCGKVLREEHTMYS